MDRGTPVFSVIRWAYRRFYPISSHVPNFSGLAGQVVLPSPSLADRQPMTFAILHPLAWVLEQYAPWLIQGLRWVDRWQSRFRFRHYLAVRRLGSLRQRAYDAGWLHTPEGRRYSWLHFRPWRAERPSPDPEFSWEEGEAAAQAAIAKWGKLQELPSHPGLTVARAQGARLWRKA